MIGGEKLIGIVERVIRYAVSIRVDRRDPASGVQCVLIAGQWAGAPAAQWRGCVHGVRKLRKAANVVVGVKTVRDELCACGVGVASERREVAARVVVGGRKGVRNEWPPNVREIQVPFVPDTFSACPPRDAERRPAVEPQLQ